MHGIGERADERLEKRPDGVETDGVETSFAGMGSMEQSAVLRQGMEDGSMRWIVGLGNPGAQYERTRHNVGFMVIDRLAERWNIPVNRNKHRALIGEGVYAGVKVALIKPMTYMNLSGEAVRAFMDFYRVPLDDGIIVYDDLDTEFGSIRLRYKGGPGGHNGIRSIIRHVGTEQFKRLRIGISRPISGADMADYVLAPFSRAESERLPDVLERACDALEAALREPFEKVMAQFNK